MTEAVFSIKEGLAYIVKKENRQAAASWLQPAISPFCQTTAAAGAALICTCSYWSAYSVASAWRVRSCANNYSLSRCACFERLCSSGSMPYSDRNSTVSGICSRRACLALTGACLRLRMRIQVSTACLMGLPAIFATGCIAHINTSLPGENRLAGDVCNAL